MRSLTRRPSQISRSVPKVTARVFHQDRSGLVNKGLSIESKSTGVLDLSF
jgi:hypothetical protein